MSQYRRDPGETQILYCYEYTNICLIALHDHDSKNQSGEARTSPERAVRNQSAKAPPPIFRPALKQQFPMLLQPGFSRLKIGAEACDLLPKPARMIHLPQMRQFMKHNVVGNRAGHLDQPPVE